MRVGVCKRERERERERERTMTKGLKFSIQPTPFKVSLQGSWTSLISTNQCTNNLTITNKLFQLVNLFRLAKCSGPSLIWTQLGPKYLS